METRLITMEAWLDAAKTGAAPPVTICLEGDSMRPLIRRGRDPVTIVPLQRPLKRGDVVLFTLGDGRYVLHRLWKMQGDRVQTLGDNCCYPEPWFSRAQVLGLAIRFSRDGKSFRLDTKSSRLLGRAWMAALPVRRCLLRLRAKAGRCYRKLFPRKGGECHGG